MLGFATEHAVSDKPLQLDKRSRFGPQVELQPQKVQTVKSCTTGYA